MTAIGPRGLAGARQPVVAGPPRDFVGYGRDAPQVGWPGGARVALSIVLNWEEGSELSLPDGDPEGERLAEAPAWGEAGQRDLAIESTFEYGSRVGVWRLARLFDELEIPVTVFATALALERNEEVAAWIRESPHEAACHGWRWESPAGLGREREREHMLAAIESMTRTLGERPLGWYSRYAPSIHTRDLVVSEGGFLYDSDAYNDDLPYFVEVRGRRHTVVPYSLLHNDLGFVTGTSFADTSSFVDLLRRALDYLVREGEHTPKMMSVGLHCRWAGQPSRASALREFLEYALARQDVWFARRVDIARWWQSHDGFLHG
jgi:peptidoglycan/xylan/chitin deacetylase (PgdA/CDA1 family)